MSEIKIKAQRYQRRKNRTRKSILGKTTRPRLTVARSNKHFYAQIIDDLNGKTLVSVHEKEIDGVKLTKSQKAAQLGKTIAEKALGLKISGIVFDKGAYRYHGRVKAFADTAREGGLKF